MDGYTYDRAEAIKIESDERGFELHVETTEHGTIVLDIHSVVFALYGEVVANIVPYVAEAQAAQSEYRSGIANDPAQQAVLDRIKDYAGNAEDDEAILVLEDLADQANKARKENQ